MKRTETIPCKGMRRNKKQASVVQAGWAMGKIVEEEVAKLKEAQIIEGFVDID